MLKPWIYLQNPFFNCTKKNFKKAVKISKYTDAQLLAKIAEKNGVSADSIKDVLNEFKI